MKAGKKNRMGLSQAIGIVAFFCFSGCGGISTKGGSGCTAKTALINVYTNQMTRVCGCTEGQGTFNSSSPLQCTVALNTIIYFHFDIADSSNHQITYQGGSTQQYTNTNTPATAALTMTASGTIAFADLNGVGGNIIVTP